MPLKANDHCCEEAALGMPAGAYFPCNKPALFVIGWKGRSDAPIRVCLACSDHNIKNRGGELLRRYDPTPDSVDPAGVRREDGT